MTKRFGYTVKDLLYATHVRCRCGAGLAYATAHASVRGEWTCSRVLLGEVEVLTGDDPQPDIAPKPSHDGFSYVVVDTSGGGHDVLPFAFFDPKSEGQPSAEGATTRPGGTHIEWEPHCTCKKCGHAWVASRRRPSAPSKERLGGLDCPQCGAQYLSDGFAITGSVDARYPTVVVEDDPPPAPQTANDHLCPKCGKRWTGVYASGVGGYDCMCNRCGYAEHHAPSLPAPPPEHCAYCHSVPCECPKPTAPEPERFWRVYRRGAEDWFAYKVRRDGESTLEPSLSPLNGRDTESAARADGIASGMKEWKP